MSARNVAEQPEGPGNPPPRRSFWDTNFPATTAALSSFFAEPRARRGSAAAPAADADARAGLSDDDPTSPSDDGVPQTPTAGRKWSRSLDKSTTAMRDKLLSSRSRQSVWRPRGNAAKLGEGWWRRRRGCCGDPAQPAAASLARSFELDFSIGTGTQLEPPGGRWKATRTPAVRPRVPRTCAVGAASRARDRAKSTFGRQGRAPRDASPSAGTTATACGDAAGRLAATPRGGSRRRRGVDATGRLAATPRENGVRRRRGTTCGGAAG